MLSNLRVAVKGIKSEKYLERNTTKTEKCMKIYLLLQQHGLPKYKASSKQQSNQHVSCNKIVTPQSNGINSFRMYIMQDNPSAKFLPSTMVPEDFRTKH